MNDLGDSTGFGNGRGTVDLYVRAVRRHRVTVVLVTVAAVLGSVAWLALRSPTYAAEAQVLVTPLAPDDQTFVGLQVLRDSGDDPTRVLTTATTIIKSPAAAAATARSMGRGWSVKKVLDQVDVTPVNQSSLLSITARAEDARTSARLANTFARSALAVRNDVLARQLESLLPRLRARQRGLPRDSAAGSTDLADRINQLESVRQGNDPTLSLIERAAPPPSPSGPPAPLIVLLALVTGLALGVGAALLLELLNRRLRDEEEAQELYPLPVLARVPIVARRARSEINDLRWNIAPPVLEAFRTLLVQLAPPGEETNEGRVIMVTSASTGDGKTTSAINLAMSIAAGGHDALLLDLDVRKPAVQRMLNLDRAQPIATLVGADLNGKDFSRLTTSVPTMPNLSVLATLPSSVGDIGLVEGLHQRLPELIDRARKAADFVIIDTSPLGEVSDALRIADQVDDILAIVRPGNTDRRNFEVMRDLLERTGHRPNGLLVVGAEQRMTGSYYEHGMSVRQGGDPIAQALHGRTERSSSVRVRR